MDKPVCTGSILQCTQGLSNKHYERLIQCDKHLNLVSQHPDFVLDSPYFDFQASAKGSPTSSFNDVESTPAAQSSSEIGQNSVGLVPEHLSPQAPSPSSVIDLRAIELNESRGGNGLQAQQSMSMSDIANHISHKISERMNSRNASGNEETIECDQDMPENIAQILLGDTQCPAASDEKKPSPTDNILRCHCIKNLSCYTQISTLKEYISNKALLINCRGKPNFITDATVNFPAK